MCCSVRAAARGCGGVASGTASLQLPLPLFCWRHKGKLLLFVLYIEGKWTFDSPNCLSVVGASLKEEMDLQIIWTARHVLEIYEIRLFDS